MSDNFDLVVVEGVGGVLVPYDNKNLVIDIARGLKLPVLLVVQNKLGAINHTLLTLEALRKRKFKLLGVIFNNLKKEDPRILKDNVEIIKRFCREKILGVLERQDNINKLQREFEPIGKKIKILL